ncbi:MAG: ATP-binding protein [Breznakiellaceae bacterium]
MKESRKKNPYKLRQIFVILDSITLGVSILFLVAISVTVVRVAYRDFSHRRRQELISLDSILNERLTTAALQLEEIENNHFLENLRHLSLFSDVYVLSNLRVEGIIKKSPSSAVFVGFTFSQPPLSSFLRNHYFSTVRRSSVIRAPENEKPSVYYTYPVKEKLLVGRLELQTLGNEILRLVRYDGSIVVFTSSEGIPFTSMGGNISNIVFSFSLQNLTLQGKKFVVTPTKNIWLGIPIFLLTPVENRDAIISPTIFLSQLAILIFAGILAIRFFLLHTMLLSPLSAFIDSIAAWDTTKPLPPLSKKIENIKEIREMAETFYAKAYQIQQFNEKLENQLQEKNSILRQTVDKLIVSEKMAVLGAMSANIAHAINTPLAAIKSTAESSAVSLDYLRSVFRSMLENNYPEQKLCIEYLVNNLHTYSYTRKEKKELYERLKTPDGALPFSQEILDDLIDLGINVLDEKIIEYGQNFSHFGEIVHILYHYEILFHNLSVIPEMIDRAAMTIQSLYLWTTSNESRMQLVSIQKEIELLLSIYAHQIKNRIRVVTSFKEPGIIKAQPDRLRAVWINLISNAIQAIEKKGTISVSIEPAPVSGYILVRIEDSGRGIPEKDKALVFTPFFTLYKENEGPGLGLDLCKRIVEEHGGTLTFESEEGRTVFTVSLPRAKE